MACRCISTMVCMDKHTLCISNDGKMYSFGNSYFGGHGHEEKLYVLKDDFFVEKY